MPGVTEDKVKLLCVKLKPNDTPEKVKAKILKGLRKAEKKSSSSCAITHPLQNWTNEIHSLGDLDSKNVAKVVSNSRYIAFLMRDGRVCRIRCSSKTPSRRNSVPNVGEILRRSNQAVPSFQELSDAEYAKQLQARFDSERRSGGGVGAEGRGQGLAGGVYSF